MAMRLPFLLIMSLIGGQGASAQTPVPTPAVANGAHRWLEAPAPATGSLALVVSIARQQLYVYRDGRLIGVSSVSTGARGRETPRGQFTILQKNKWHRSNLYSNAPMPYMQRLTWDGIALHGGHLPGYPASHGCIRMPHAFAERLFAMTRLGVPVAVERDFAGTPVHLVAAPVPWDGTVVAAPPRLPYDLRIYFTGQAR